MLVNGEQYNDHPKNHSFLYNGSTLNLSPCYDLLPTLSSFGINTDFDLACTFGINNRQANLDNLLSKIETFGLTEFEAIHILKSMAKVIQNWEELFIESGVSKKDINLFRDTFQSTFLKEVIQMPTENSISFSM